MATDFRVYTCHRCGRNLIGPQVKECLECGHKFCEKHRDEHIPCLGEKEAA